MKKADNPSVQDGAQGVPVGVQDFAGAALVRGPHGHDVLLFGPGAIWRIDRAAAARLHDQLAILLNPDPAGPLSSPGSGGACADPGNLRGGGVPELPSPRAFSDERGRRWRTG